jgi:hypothetical protein
VTNVIITFWGPKKGPLDEARTGYLVGAVVLNAVLPAHPTAFVPVESGNLVLSKEEGIEAKSAVIVQLAAALDVLDPLIYTTTIIELLFEDYSPVKIDLSTG